MGEPTGFLRWGRATPSRRPVPVRLRDWREVYEPLDREALREQAGRCMDCGIPFCNNGCPLGNLIPDWNDLVYRDQWREAIERLNREINAILQSPETRGRIEAAGWDVAGGTPEAFAQFMAAERARWQPVIKRSGARLD